MKLEERLRRGLRNIVRAVPDQRASLDSVVSRGVQRRRRAIMGSVGAGFVLVCAGGVGVLMRGRHTRAQL
jgi:hypothetical protein